MTFNDLWKFVTRNGSIVQERSELEHVFNLIKDCESYLEVGTAEGSSLCVLARSLKENAKITYVDYGEDKTHRMREENLRDLSNPICALHKDSHDIRAVALAHEKGPYDVVFIDAGHTYEDVILDAVNYAPMAKKFVLFHDINMPPVRKAFEWYCRQYGLSNISYFAIENSPYGYGIIKL